jgi:hypothetical protein
MTGKRILLLNTLILVGIMICAHQLISGWRDFEAEQNLEQVVSRLSSQPIAVSGDLAGFAGAERVERDFLVVADRNLFSPERRPEVMGESEEEGEKAPEFPRRPKMSGVTERGGERLAFLTVFESKKDSGRTEQVGVGTVVQGYVVTEITDTTLTLTWNDQNVLIDMLDSEPSKPPARAPAKVAALNIIRIGSKVAAVETTAPEAAPPEEGRGLQVGVVGGQAAAGRAGGRTGLSGRSGMMGRGGGAGSSLGRGSQSMGRQGFPSTVGGLGGSRQNIPNQQRRY